MSDFQSNLQQIAETEARFTPPTMVCRHPEHWHSADSDSTEMEITDFIGGLVRALQPEVVIETGTAFGQTAFRIGHALELNGHGHLYSYEVDPVRVAHSRDRCRNLDRVSIIEEPSIDALSEWDEPIDFAFLDSLFDLRPQELPLVVRNLSPLGVIAVHDAGAKYAKFRDQMIDLATDLGLSCIEFPTPRGLLLMGRTLR